MLTKVHRHVVYIAVFTSLIKTRIISTCHGDVLSMYSHKVTNMFNMNSRMELQ